MNNRELIKSQLEKAKPLTQEIMKDILEKRKTVGSEGPLSFTSGRLMKEGDYILFGFIVSESDEKFEPKASFTNLNPPAENIKPLSLKLISFHPDEYESIYIDDGFFYKRRGPNGYSEKDMPCLKIK